MKRSNRITRVVTLALMTALPCITHAQETRNVESEILKRSQKIQESLLREALHAIRIGVEYLEQNQHEDGYWSSPGSPAITALAVSSMLNSPDVLIGGKTSDSAAKGLNFIVSCAQENGGIYQFPGSMSGAGMPNYNTAICLTTLDQSGDAKYTNLIQQAHAFLAQGQHLGSDVFRGGMGYDLESERTYADLSNTVFALEALRRTEPLEKPADSGPTLNWDAAIDFISNCQHLRDSNKADWVNDNEAERGGFVYNPVESKAGIAEAEDGDGTFLRSYGGMTYAGLLSFLYAQVDREDPRVKGAIDWIQRRWTLDENPGIGEQGLYYHYHTMAKALHAYGQEVLTLPDGKKIAWRPALVEKLLSLQRIDPETGLGYWQNDNNRWWENDPNLSTCYTLLALEYAVLGTGISYTTNEQGDIRIETITH